MVPAQESSGFYRVLMLAGFGVVLSPLSAIAAPEEITIQLPAADMEVSQVSPEKEGADPEAAEKSEAIAQVNVRIEGVETERQQSLPNVRPRVTTPNAELDLGPAQVTFPGSAPNSVAPGAAGQPAMDQSAAGQSAAGQQPTPASVSPQVAQPQTSSPSVATPRPGGANPAVVPSAVAAPIPSVATPYNPAVINLTTFQPPIGAANPVVYGGAAPTAMPSNVQLVCTPGAGAIQQPGGAVAQANQAGGATLAGLPAGAAGGGAQQALGSVLNPGGAARRPGLFGGLIPNPTVGVDVGPVTLDVPIPISALFNLGRNSNRANQPSGPAATPAVNPVNGAPVTTAAGPAAGTAAGVPGVAQPSAYPTANNPYGVPTLAYPTNLPGATGGVMGGAAMPVMTQVVTSQPTVINFTTLRPVAGDALASRATNVGLNSVAGHQNLQASTVQLVCNPGAMAAPVAPVPAVAPGSR